VNTELSSSSLLISPLSPSLCLPPPPLALSLSSGPTLSPPDDLFQSVKATLFVCGQTCLRRLSALIMEDINDHLQEVSLMLTTSVSHLPTVGVYPHLARDTSAD
jgi:hypothetical protein